MVPAHLDAVTRLYNTFIMSAVGAAIVLPRTLNTVSDYPTSAMCADRCELLDGALETIKSVLSPLDTHLKAFIVLIVTRRAFAHHFLHAWKEIIHAN